MTYTATDRRGIKREVCVERGEHWLRLLTEVTDVGLLMTEEWAEEFAGVLQFPLYQGILCDFDKGQVHAFLQSAGGNRLFDGEVTYYRRLWRSTTVYRLLLGDPALWKQVVAEMNAVTNQRMQELEPELLPVMTRFPGYSREFYDAVPYNLEDDRLPDSFQEIAARMRTPQDALELFESSRLPKSKLVRRFFCNQPQMLFFLKEHEQIFWLLGSAEQYRLFLQRDRYLLDILYELHRRPLLRVFLKDFASVCGPEQLLNQMQKEWPSVLSYAKEYVSLGTEGRKAARQQWNGRIKYSFHSQPLQFSVPMAKGNKQMKDIYTVSGFTVRRLKTSREYMEVANALNNCLGCWPTFGNPVYCFCNDEGDPVGAAEVLGQTVVQARAYENKSLEVYPGLQEAYEEWLDQAELTDDDFFDMDDPDMPLLF